MHALRAHEIHRASTAPDLDWLRIEIGFEPDDCAAIRALITARPGDPGKSSAPAGATSFETDSFQARH